MLPLEFTYPFRYVPHPLVVDAANSLISRIDNNPELKDYFKCGKMLGVLVCKAADSEETRVLNAFSGLAGGHAFLDGFVPPVFDTTSLSELWKSERPSEESAALQDQLFREYKVSNALGEKSDVKSIFAERGIIPPGGTGECAGPKLLNYAYANGLKPLCMGEFWYGESPKSGEVREHGRFYPSCTGKCGPLVSWMIRGLNVEPNPLQRTIDESEIKLLYKDDTIVVVSKPSGMLCAPGLTGTKSLQEILEADFGTLYSCHRLDMDTSGVMVFARTPEAQIDIQKQFSDREVKKTYIAHLCAGNRPWKGKKTGTIALPLAPDWYDRPRQMVDRINGKLAITEFEILQIFPDGEMEIRFTPKTGRTHQLRVHSASPLGLGRPIKGDALYGSADSSSRLELYAESISFRHPSRGETVSFSI